MMAPESKRAVVLGAGAIGALYGYCLARVGWDVSVVCRSDYEQVVKHGFVIDSVLLGRCEFRPAKVSRSSADFIGAAPDYAIVTTKVVPGVDRVAMLRPVVGAETCIVLIENGLDIEHEIRAAFPGNEIVSVLALVQASRTSPGTVRHAAFGELSLGTFPTGLSAQAREIANAWQHAGIKCKLTAQVETARWQKCVWNAAFNIISAIGGGIDTATILATESGRMLCRSAMNEVVAVAAAAGHELPEVLVDQYMTTTVNMPSYLTSMALDALNGRPLEVDVILGPVVHRARALNVPTPVLDVLLPLAQMVNAKLSGSP